MTKFGLLSSTALFGAFAFSTSAAAQDSPASCTPEQEAAGTCSRSAQGGEGSIIVTGSRIRSPNIVSQVPVVSVSAQDLTSQGDVNVGDALNDLPSLRSTFSQSNSTRFIGTTGLNLLDLRGLGTNRTLVLVNGRRHVTSSVGDFLVDVNTIPSDLIERVDVITGGSSAVYGSDAIAGVVNFVLRRDYEGISVRAQNGISEQGDRNIYFVSATAGRNFFDDRLNVAANLEYVRAQPLYFAERDDLTGAYSGRCQFNSAEATAGEPATGGGGADTRFQCGTFNNNISTGGMVFANISAANCQNPAFGPGGASAAIGAARCYRAGTSTGQPRIFVFDTNGNLVDSNPLQDHRPFGTGTTAIGGLGSTLRETGQIAPGLERITGNLLLNLNLSTAFQPFAELKYVHIESLQEGQPTFFQSSFPAFFGAGRGIRCDNPFLTADNIAQLQQAGRCLGGPASTETLAVSRFNIDFGGRRQFVERETWRFVGGFRGDFNEDWNYEVAFNYGRFEQRVDALNDLRIFDIDAAGNVVAEGPFLRAIDAVRNGAGQIVCRVNADANPANDDPACVPLNVFGTFVPSRAALDYVTYTSSLDGRATQWNALAFVNGDLSQLFEFPGGPARFVIGGEWRRETAFQLADPLSRAGATFFNAFPTFDPPALEVWEAFGELSLPLLRDLPFAHELTISGAARYSDYSTSAGSTFAWNVSGTWAPVRDLRFRANFSRAVRVPTIGDLFTPPTQTFAFLADPCDVQNINTGTANRAANCAADGVPVGFINLPARSQTSELVVAGNPNLSEETSDSYTIGLVFQPRWVPGLSFTADYYNITLKNRIEVIGGQTILNQCYDLPRPNEFCSLIFPRNPDSTFGQPAVLQAGVNFARGEAEGIDFELSYRRNFGSDWRFEARAIATYVINRTDFISPINPDFGTPVVENLGDPRWAANLSATIGYREFDFRYSMNMIGWTYTTTVTNVEPFQGRPPQNPDIRDANELRYPDTYYHAIRMAWRATEQFQFYFGVDNLLDTRPPFGLLGTGGGDPYDPIGRYFYAGATIRF